MDYEIDLSDDFDFYLNEIIAPITNDKDVMNTHSTSKFLFYHFNNLRLDLKEDFGRFPAINNLAILRLEKCLVLSSLVTLFHLLNCTKNSTLEA